MLYGVLLSVLAAFCWGSTTLLMRGMKHLGPVEMTLGRALGAFAAALLIALCSGSPAALFCWSSADVTAFAVLVIANNILGDIALFLALHMLGVAYGSSISSTYPIVVAVISVLFFGETFSFSIVTGTLLVVAGVVCLCQRKGGQGQLSTKGLLLAVLASLLWGVGLSMNKYLVLQGLSAQSIAFGRSFFFLLITGVYWLLRSAATRSLAANWVRLMHKELCLALTGGALAIGLGGFLYALALQYVPATVATPIGASNPLLATVAAKFLFGEKLRPVQWLGICIVVAGTVVVTR